MPQLLVVSLFVLGAISIPCLLALFILQRYCSPLSPIPGPALGSFGTVYKCWHTVIGDYPVTLTALHRKFGSLVRISYNEVSIADSEGLRVLNSTMDKGPQYECFAIPSAQYQNTMSERSYKQTMRMRQNVAQGYSHTHLIKGEQYLDDLLSLMTQRIAEDSKDGTQQIELGKWIHFFTMDVVGEMTCSAPFGFLREARDIGNSIWNTSRLASYISFMGSCRWLHYLLLGSPLLSFVDYEKIPFIHVWTTCLNGVARRKANSMEARYDMMEHWMAQRRKDPERMQEQELLTAMLANLGAGGDTIGSSIQAFFYFLLKSNSYYLEKVRQELGAAGHVAGGGSDGRPVSYSECQKLVFLQACMKETLRMFSPVPWTLQRVVPAQGMRIAGRHFSAGTILSVSPYAVHHNKDIWGADADEFKPERWLKDPKQVQEMEKYYIPYGSGYNSCLGHNLAQLELEKVTATVLRDFDLRLVNPEKEWKLHYKFVMNPSGWPVYASKRK